MRIRFLSDQVYETEGPGRGPKFAAGLVLDADGVGAALGRDVAREWAEGFLRRWTARGVAEEVDRRTPTAEERKADEEKKDAPKPVPVLAVSQPLGTAKRGEPTKGVDRP